MPSDGPLEENKHWILVPKNTVYVAEHLSVCFSVLRNTFCFLLKEKLYAVNMEQHRDYYQLSMVAIVGLHTHKGVYHTFNSLPVPPCTLDTSHNDSSLLVFVARTKWHHCFSPQTSFCSGELGS